jgi:SAM-dependent methyltransferase
VSQVTTFIKKHPALLRTARTTFRWLNPIYRQPLRSWPGYVRLFADWRKYCAAGGKARIADFYPCLADRTQTTRFDPQYFFQAIWAFKNITARSPRVHVDIGSEVSFVGILSTATQVEFVDIRPLPVQLENLVCKAGSIVELPYADSSVESASSMHVLEHIGLGRYGDTIDPEGTLKACRELVRILAPGGSLYVSIPVGTPRVKFNGLRIFSVKEVLEYFRGLNLVEMSLVDNFGQYHSAVDPESILFDEETAQDFALGCFHLSKK